MGNNVDIIKDIMFKFESILCLVTEGQEFMNKIEMADAVAKDATRGYNLCSEWITRQIYEEESCLTRS